MNQEILLIAEQLKDVYEGKPWFGRNMNEILSEIHPSVAFEKPNGQHSILELLWHMITWKEFTLSRLRSDSELPVTYFEQNDWRELDHSDPALFKRALDQLAQLHNELIEVIRQQKDGLLSQGVRDRDYNFRKLLYGIVQHDIYHLGQIAYVKKIVANQPSGPKKQS